MTMKKLLLAALLLAAPAAQADDNQCKYATKGDSAVAQACKKGGRDAAGDIMKTMVKTAKANGVAFKCIACHEDMDSFKPKANADEDFKKLVAAQLKK
jgi:hypothetical protein